LLGKQELVENFTKINGVRTQLTIILSFVAFAKPVDQCRKLLLAVYMKMAIFGGRYAGHIAAPLIEKYLKGTITRTGFGEKNVGKNNRKRNMPSIEVKPFRINERNW